MVDIINKGNKKYYQCSVCKFIYREKEFAGKCEEWCSKNNSCNLEIIKKSVKIK